jgi:Fe-S-cluster containining protein
MRLLVTSASKNLLSFFQYRRDLGKWKAYPHYTVHKSAGIKVKYNRFSYISGDCVLQFENVVFPDGVGFRCKGCGRCCKEQPADVTSEERQRIENKGITNFLDENDLTEPRLIRNRQEGGCFFLTLTNECKIHEVKPVICHIVPFVVTDWDYTKNLIEVDIPADCDCPGINDTSQIPFETISKAAQIYVYNTQKAIAQQEQLPLNDQVVLSKTRQMLIKLAMDEDQSL